MRRRPKGEWNRSGPLGLRRPDSDELVRAHSRSAADPSDPSPDKSTRTNRPRIWLELYIGNRYEGVR
ncbi:MAG: hypothetical protein GX455_09245 [Phycisphaerae bacterium]|nr:hypothetical protein [Phycisphaerae bacterium]